MPPTPQLATWKFPLQQWDVLGVAIVLRAVLVSAEIVTRGSMEVAAGQGAHLGVGHRLMAEPADPHRLGGRQVGRASPVPVRDSWVAVAPFPAPRCDPSA